MTNLNAFYSKPTLLQIFSTALNLLLSETHLVPLVYSIRESCWPTHSFCDDWFFGLFPKLDCSKFNSELRESFIAHESQRSMSPTHGGWVVYQFVLCWKTIVFFGKNAKNFSATVKPEKPVLPPKMLIFEFQIKHQSFSTKIDIRAIIFDKLMEKIFI